MQLSARSLEAPASPIRKLVPFAVEAKQRGIHVYHLNIGQPDLATPEVMWDALRRANIEVLDYSPSGGIPEFRKGLMEYYARYGIELEDDEMIVTTAGSEAILFALSVIADPGDQVIIPEPLYANYNGYAALLGVEVVPVASEPESGYALPSDDEIEKRITGKTRAIVISNPCNPTGHVYTAEEMDRLVDLCLKHDLFLIADEVYREFFYGSDPPRGVLTYERLRDRSIMVDSISKRFSACGARIGALASHNTEVIAAAMKFAQARLSPPTLGQVMATAAVRLPQSYYDEIVAEYRLRRDAVLEELAKIDGVLCRKPEGAFYIMATLPVDDAEAFVRWMLTDFSAAGKTTMMAPGAGFYATPGSGTKEVRIAYVLEEQSLREAISIVAAGLKRYPGARG